MNWQEKLHILIGAYKQGHILVRDYFSFEVPPKRQDVDSKLDSLAEKLELEPNDAGTLQPLRDFYGITDGMVVAAGLMVFGLVSNRFETLEDVNRTSLGLVRDRVAIDFPELTTTISMIFGSDEAGDFLCLSRDGEVIWIGNDARDFVVIANSLDIFFNDFCFGSGFMRHYHLNADDPWVSILRDFGFL